MYPNLEYIIIDGGSTDNSVDIIKKYEKYLTYWVSEPDKGQTNAINKGFKIAKGEIITWLNSDDYYESDTLILVSEHFKNLNFDFLAGSVNIVSQSGNLIDRKSPKWPVYNENIYNAKIYLPQPSTFFRRKLLERVGFLDERFNFSMDFDFWIRLRQAKVNFELVDDVLANFRMHSDSKTNQGDFKFRFEIIKKYAKLRHLTNQDNRNLLRRLLPKIVITEFDQYSKSYHLYLRLLYFMLRKVNNQNKCYSPKSP